MKKSKSSLKSAHFWVIKAKKNPKFRILLGCWYSNTLADTKEKILESFQPKVMSKTEAISQKLQKQPKMSKNGHFWVIKAKKIPVFEFLQEYQYSNTLEDTKEKILGNFSQN